MIKFVILSPTHERGMIVARFLGFDPKSTLIATTMHHLEGHRLEMLNVISEEPGELENFALDQGASVHRFSDDPVRRFKRLLELKRRNLGDRLGAQRLQEENR